jgi:hypothetical protein
MPRQLQQARLLGIELILTKSLKDDCGENFDLQKKTGHKKLLENMWQNLGVKKVFPPILINPFFVAKVVKKNQSG